MNSAEVDETRNVNLAIKFSQSVQKTADVQFIGRDLEDTSSNRYTYVKVKQ